jgi:hypothetical protein
MDHRSVMPAPLQIPRVGATTASTSQVLWHACRRDSPAVTAILTSTPPGEYEVQVGFGTVAVQRVPYSSAVAAVEFAERLLTQLEARGYQRQRRDKRTMRPQSLKDAWSLWIRHRLQRIHYRLASYRIRPNGGTPGSSWNSMG